MLLQNERIRLWTSTDPATREPRTGWIDPLADLPISEEAAQTPAWSLGAVWYNIFPERFDNANPDNDQSWPHATRLPWDQDWFEVTADEFEASANRAIASPWRYGDAHTRARQPLHDTVFERRYGGDLQGVTRRLDHIAGLGATVVWFCPIFESTSLHKYDAADHRHIDPHLAHPSRPEGQRPAFTTDQSAWAWTPADRYFVDTYLPAAKARGLRTVLDGVWNHGGIEHPAFQDVLTAGEGSRYAPWFHFDTDALGRTVGWQAWNRRNGTLPEFQQTGDDLAPGPKQHVFDVTRRWMDPNADGDPSDGIDGWRLDVANEIGLGFWGDWRSLVREINDQAVLVGELWFDGADYFGGRAFDAQMNYPLAFALTSWLGRTPGFDSEQLASSLDRVFSHEPATDLAQVNLLGSHDTARILSMMQNPGLDYDGGAGLADHDYDRSPPSAHAIDRLELAYAVLTVLPGSPMVYAGDELGLWGADDPENRKPLDWAADRSTSERIANWLTLRSDPTIGPTLRYGIANWRTENGLLVISRGLDSSVARLIANPNDEPHGFSGLTISPRSAILQRNTNGEWITLQTSSTLHDNVRP